MPFLDLFRKNAKDEEETPVTETSVLSAVEVQRSLSGGAPATPWAFKKEDHAAMEKLATYFAKAIPVPTPEGRVYVTETRGNGGPQLELYVPVLSVRNPVAILAREWHPEGAGLETSLFFFGATDGRLAKIVSQLGFIPRGEGSARGVAVFRNQSNPARKRAG